MKHCRWDIVLFSLHVQSQCVFSNQFYVQMMHCKLDIGCVFLHEQSQCDVLGQFSWRNTHCKLGIEFCGPRVQVHSACFASSSFPHEPSQYVFSNRFSVKMKYCKWCMRFVFLHEQLHDVVSDPICGRKKHCNSDIVFFFPREPFQYDASYQCSC